jgi:DNA mismatch repair protein MutH
VSAAGEREILALARSLGGRTLGEVARFVGRALPRDPARHKGAAGTLIERALGADGGSRHGPDFAALGIEVKTLPVDARGRAVESTFVCCVPQRSKDESWERSPVRAKLARVLWIPIETHAPFAERRIGSALLWSPSPALEETLRADWEDLAELLASGAERISARHGRALQLRPKAHDASVRLRGADPDGAPALEAPRGFYLRRWVTRQVLEEAGLAPRAARGAARCIWRS